MRAIVLIIACMVATSTPARPWKKFVLKTVEHLALGAGIEAGTSQIAGGAQKYPVGLATTGLVAGFKEGSDAINYTPATATTKQKGDTKKMAAWHAFMIVAGAGILAAARHK